MNINTRAILISLAKDQFANAYDWKTNTNKLNIEQAVDYAEIEMIKQAARWDRFVEITEEDKQAVIEFLTNEENRYD